MPIRNPNDLGNWDNAEQEIPNEVHFFKTSAAVTANTVVSTGTTGLIATTATDGTASLCVGVAPQAIASGDTGPVITWGYVEGVTAQGTIAAGDILKRSATTTGALAATATPAAGEAIGVAIAASSGGTVKAFLKGVALS